MKLASISLGNNRARAAARPAALLLLLSFLLTFTLPQAQAQKFTLKRLNPPGSTYAFAFGLNNQGTIVGSFVKNDVYEAFIYDGAKYKTFVFSKSATLTQASAVNDSGVVVGEYTDTGLLSHGFLLRNGKPTSYDVKKGASTYIYGINNAGNFVGYSNKQGQRANAFVNIGGTVKQFTFQGNYTFAFGIDSANDVVGDFIDSSFNTHGFYRAASGRMTQIDYPDSLLTACLGINDLGEEITGLYLDTNNVSHGFIRKKGKFHSFRLPDIAGINNAGVFVGGYTGKDNKNYGYVATPR